MAELVEKQRKLLLFIAKSLHLAELDEESLTMFRKAIDMDAHLSPKHRHFFFDLVRCLVNPIRNSLRSIMDARALERREPLSTMLRESFTNGRKQLDRLCEELLAIVDQQLIPNCEDTEGRVDFMRFQGDLYRYLLEYAPKDRVEMIKERCQSVYSSAVTIAREQLPVYSVARLGVVLNWSLFLAEHAERVTDAVALAEEEMKLFKATDADLEETVYQRALTFARRIQDKIMQWKA